MSRGDGVPGLGSRALRQDQRKWRGATLWKRARNGESPVVENGILNLDPFSCRWVRLRLCLAYDGFAASFDGVGRMPSSTRETRSPNYALDKREKTLALRGRLGRDLDQIVRCIARAGIAQRSGLAGGEEDDRARSYFGGGAADRCLDLAFHHNHQSLRCGGLALVRARARRQCHRIAAKHARRHRRRLEKPADLPAGAPLRLRRLPIIDAGGEGSAWRAFGGWSFRGVARLFRFVVEHQIRRGRVAHIDDAVKVVRRVEEQSARARSPRLPVYHHVKFPFLQDNEFLLGVLMLRMRREAGVERRDVAFEPPESAGGPIGHVAPLADIRRPSDARFPVEDGRRQRRRRRVGEREASAPREAAEQDAEDFGAKSGSHGLDARRISLVRNHLPALADARRSRRAGPRRSVGP